MTSLVDIYQVLFENYGHQDWWPGETDFEIMVGAILTQNVNWKNVETAIQNLKREGLLDPRSIVNTENEVIEELIRPSGFYRQKSKRLKRLSEKNYRPWRRKGIFKGNRSEKGVTEHKGDRARDSR